MIPSMKPLALLPLALGFLVALPDPDPGREPEGRYRLTLDGETVTLVPGRPTTVRVGDRTHQLLLEAPRTRVFDNHGIHFEYPATMGFEYDGETPGVHLWTFDGNNSVLMVQEYEPFDRDQTREVLSEGLRTQFESMGATLESSPCRLDVAGGPAEGLRLEILMGDVGLVQELYCFQGPGGGVALILQDTRDPGAAASEEFRVLTERVAGTLRIDG